VFFQNFDDFMRGLGSQSLQEFNNIYTEEMTEWLFAENNQSHGLDIVALNVQRGRDHQIQGYTAYK
jgi:peroxidase